jgi:hypothetical protein
MTTTEAIQPPPPPPPPVSLLAPGQRWTTIPAPGWAVVTARRICRYNVGGDRPRHCGEPAVVEEVHAFCEAHMGSFRWITEGVVMQWRATFKPMHYLKPKPEGE